MIETKEYSIKPEGYWPLDHIFSETGNHFWTHDGETSLPKVEPENLRTGQQVMAKDGTGRWLLAEVISYCIICWYPF